MSAQELAGLAGISTTQNLTRIERGVVSNPTYDTVERVLTAVNKLDIIVSKGFNYDNYSQGLRDALNRFRNDADYVVTGEPVIIKLPEELMNASKLDVEKVCAMIALLNDYPAFRDALHELCNTVERNCETPERIDYATVINDLTKLEYTQFYFNLNDTIRKFVKTRCFTHAYEFMTMLVQALNEGIASYADKDDAELPIGERQARSRRRRMNNEGAPVPAQ
jgi:transcriptional regulator with XRE-family HTH domain